MALDSPTISEQDSLIEQEPIQNGTPNYSTFTRKRPVNLPNSLKKKKRQSLMSPQSIPNLDSDDLQTPDFAMTQSMYEPLEKRKQQDKLDSNSKLLRLLASEKANQAAMERKIKEIKRKSIDQRKKNEAKQKLAEERRIRMLADQESKKRKIMDKINVTGNMTVSCYGNITKSIIKPKNPLGSGFIDRRPISSTGKVFGFGSSAPREVCEKPIYEKLKDKDARPDFKKSQDSLSRMCTSQIITKVNFGGDNKPKKFIKESPPKPISASSFNVSHFNRALIKSKKASNTNKTERSSSRIRLTKPVSPEVKSPRFQSNTNGLFKPPQVNVHIEPAKKPRGRSMEKTKSPSTTTINNESRSRTTERKKPPGIQVTETSLPTNSHLKSISKPKAKQHDKAPLEPVSPNKKPSDKGKDAKTCVPIITDPVGSESSKKSEVRFEEKENIREEDLNLLSSSSISMERRRPSTNNLTEEEYKQRIALQRKMAKEKRKKEQEDRELLLQKELDLKNSQETERSFREEETKDDDSLENTKITVNNGQSENHLQEDEIKEDLVPIKINTKQDSVKESETSESGSTSVSEKAPTLTIPQVEAPNGYIEMTASTEALDRIERKKRLDSIMSRIKKPMGGSSENVTHHLSNTTIQDLLDKGHLSGMSKTAAILMRNKHSNADLSGSSMDLQNSPVHSPPYMTDGNPKSPDATGSETSEKTEESRGSCDGQEESKTTNNHEDVLTTKSNLMGNLVSNSNKPYFSAWKDKYSETTSIDVEE